MKVISPAIHGILDYLSVVFLWLSPTLFDLTGFPATFAYVLGGAYLLVSIFTDYQYGLIKMIPMRIHGLIDLIVAILLIASPWVFNFNENDPAQFFFLWFAIAVLVIWLLTDFRAAPVVRTERGNFDG